MKFLIAVLVLTPSFAQALSYPAPTQPCVIDGCTPDRPGKPLPWPKPYPKPQPKPWDADSLNNLFTGSSTKEKGAESEAVSSGEWTTEARALPALSLMPTAPRLPEPMPSIERLDQVRGEAKIVKVGGLTDAAGKVIVPIIIEAAKEAGRVIDKEVGERLSAPDTERARQEYGGCRMKGTCPK